MPKCYFAHAGDKKSMEYKFRVVETLDSKFYVQKEVERTKLKNYLWFFFKSVTEKVWENLDYYGNYYYRITVTPYKHNTLEQAKEWIIKHQQYPKYHYLDSTPFRDGTTYVEKGRVPKMKNPPPPPPIRTIKKGKSQ